MIDSIKDIECWDRLIAVLERIERRLAVLAGALMPLEEGEQIGDWKDIVFTDAMNAFRKIGKGADDV